MIVPIKLGGPHFLPEQRGSLSQAREDGVGGVAYSGGGWIADVAFAVGGGVSGAASPKVDFTFPRT